MDCAPLLSSLPAGPEFQASPETAIGSRDMSPRLLSRGEEPAVYRCLYADGYCGDAGKCEGRIEGVSIVVLEDVGGEWEDPHPDIY